MTQSWNGKLRGRFASVFGRGKPGHNVALLASGAALGQASALIALPLLTRLYSPAQFGLLAVFTSIIYVLMTVAALRLEIAVLVPEHDSEAAAVLAAALAIVTVISALTGAVLFVFREPAPDWLNAHDLGPFLWMIPLTLLGAGIFSVMNAWAMRQRDFGTMARTKFLQSFGMVLVQGIAGLLHGGTFGLLLGGAVSNAGGVDQLLRSAWRSSGAVFRRLRPREVAAAFWRYRRFPLLGAPAAIVNAIGLAFPLLALTALYQPQVAGWYVLAQRIVARPLELVNLAVAQVYNSEASRLLTANPRALTKLYLKVTGGMILIVTPYVATVALLGPPLFEFLFGSGWGHAGLYVRLLSLMFFFQVAISPIADTLEIIQRQDLYIVREISRVILVGGAVVLAAMLDLPAERTVLLLSIATTLMYLGMFGITFYAIRVRTHQLPAQSRATVE